MIRRLRLTLLTILAGLLAGSAVAQGPKERLQNITGVVRVAGSNVTVEQARVVLDQRGFHRGEVFTDGKGNFMFVGVGAGEYQVIVERDGFKTARVRANVGPMSGANVLISLEPLPGNTTAASGAVSTAELALSAEARRDYDEGMKALGKADCKASVAAFEKVVAREPKFAGGFYGLGMGHYFCRHSPRAQEALRQAIALDANFVPAYLLLGRILNNEEKFPDAEAPLRQAAAKPPERGDVQYELGRALVGQNKLAEAEQTLQRAHALEGADSQVHLLLANFRIMKGDLKGGLAEMEHYLEKDPKGPLAPEVREKAALLRAELAKQPAKNP